MYLSPWIIGFIVFQFYPFIASLSYSFTDFKFFGTPTFTGLRNYTRMFTEDWYYWGSVRRTVLYMVVVVSMKLLTAFFFAFVLSRDFRGSRFFRTALYMPSILGGSVGIAIVWRAIFGAGGTVNRVLATLGLSPVDWLGDPSLALMTVAILPIWQFGSSMIIFLAALKQIPIEYYEAAIVDGASSLQRFFRITIPLITPVILFNLVMQTIWAMQEFTNVLVVTGGGPKKATYLYVLMLYENAFRYFDMGYACAQSWVLFTMILVLTVVVFRSSSYWAFYQDEGSRS